MSCIDSLINSQRIKESDVVTSDDINDHWEKIEIR
jgi:hypothetical protein